MRHISTMALFAGRCIELGTLFTAVGIDVALLARGAEKLAGRFKETT